jgi:membrane protein
MSVTAKLTGRSPGQRLAAASPLNSAWRIAQRTYAEFFADSIPTVAGGITFFVLLALFPGIASVMSLYGFFADRATVAHDLDLISGFLPGGAITVLRAELLRLTAKNLDAPSLAFLASTAIALWSASGGFKALIEGLNVAYEVKETRGFLTLSRNALIFTVAAILFAVVGISLGLALPAWMVSSDAEPWIRIVVHVVAWPVSFAAGTLILAVIYRFGPDRKNARWRWLTWGSVIASLLWLLGTRLFTWYVEHYGSYDQVYGNLGAAVGFLTWIWLSLVILLLGAEINCELERGGNKSGYDPA